MHCVQPRDGRSRRNKIWLISQLAKNYFNPIGICYSGRWEINARTTFTGVFANDTSMLAIVRISVMLSDVKRGARRTLGMGIKLFPPNAGSAQL
jgi:hypothetical protein